MSGGYIQGLAGRYFMGPAYTPWSVADIKLAVDSWYARVLAKSAIVLRFSSGGTGRFLPVDASAASRWACDNRSPGL